MNLEKQGSDTIGKLPDDLSHYRIEKLLGSGGMGEVYQAYDQRLERKVALKHIRADSEDLYVHERLRREARAAAGLGHSSVVKIFDFLETETGAWIVMELVEGRTLAAHLEDGPFSLSLAVRLGLEIAEGLSEAHSKGILHRDLKSENVMLVRDHAKILDFGLATRLAESDGSFSDEGMILGSFKAMSPEQFLGEPLDARSDLFSFGALLYEMLTGDSPFRGPDGRVTPTRICTVRQTSARIRNPEVPENLSKLLDDLLEKIPQDRPESTADVVKTLTEIEEEILVQQSSATMQRPTFELSRSRRDVLVTVGFLALGVTGLGGGLWWSRRGAETPLLRSGIRRPPGRRSVAVMGFQNLSGRPELAWLSVALSEMLASEIDLANELRTVAGETVVRAKDDLKISEGETLAPDTLSRLQEHLGADYVVLGSYLALPEPTESLRVMLAVQSTSNGERILSTSETSTLVDLFELVESLGAQLRGALGAPDLFGPPGSSKNGLPASPDALRWYAEGLRRLRDFDLVAARELLERAVTEEPGRPLVHATLAEVYSALGDDVRAQREATRAFENADDLAPEERLFVEGRHHEMGKRWELAIDAYRTVFSRFPDNLEGGLRLARVLTLSGRGQESLAVIALLRRQPVPVASSIRIDLAEAETEVSLADFQRVLGIAQSAALRAEGQGARSMLGRARYFESLAHVRLGDHQSARRAAEEARRIYAEGGDANAETLAVMIVANLHFEAGRYAAAANLFEDALAKMRRIGHLKGVVRNLNNAASSRAQLGDLDVAEELLHEALEVGEEAGDPRTAAALHITLASLARRRGDLDAARIAAEEGVRRTRELEDTYIEGHGLLQLGQIYIASGQLAAARVVVEEELASSREARDASRSLRALVILAEVELAGGDLAAARSNLMVAADLRRSLQVRAVEVDLGLAAVDLAEGRAAVALETLSGTRAKLADLNQVVAETEAVGLLVEARLALGEEVLGKEILRELTRQAIELAKTCHDLEVRLRTTVRVARSKADLSDSGEAASLLETVRTEAFRHGYVPLELEARLELAVLARVRGDAEALEDILRVREDARGKGLQLLARQARQAAEPLLP